MTKAHDDKNYDCPATCLGDTVPGKCICNQEIEICENEPVLPFLSYLDDCETVETLPVLL